MFLIVLSPFRLWYAHMKAKGNLLHSLHIGYKNVIPRRVDATKKYPMFEDLTDTYKFVNEVLIESPLEGLYNNIYFRGGHIEALLHCVLWQCQSKSSLF